MCFFGLRGAAQHSTAQHKRGFVKLNFNTSSIPREIPDTPIFFKPKIKKINKYLPPLLFDPIPSHRQKHTHNTHVLNSYSLSSIRIGEHQKEMAPPEPEGQVQQRRQPQQQGGFSSMITGVIRMAVFWYFASKFFSPKRPSGSEPSQLISNLFHKSEPLVHTLSLSLSLIYNFLFLLLYNFIRNYVFEKFECRFDRSE